MSLGNEKYLALTTYRKDGSPRSLPIWITELPDGKLGFTTGESSYKVKRIRNDPRVQLQPSDSRGNANDGTAPHDGTAVVVTGPEFETVKERIKSKYGLAFHAMKAFGKARALMGKGEVTNCAVIITLDG